MFFAAVLFYYCGIYFILFYMCGGRPMRHTATGNWLHVISRTVGRTV